MSLASEKLYQFLPSIYRTRDFALGEPLRALLAVIESELDAISVDMDGLYENWFIETCADWVVPYIADLLGVRSLSPVTPATLSPRAYVAHALAYRRQKGTAAMVEQLAADVTGWSASAVEFYRLLAATQYLNHLRPDTLATANVRDAASLQLLEGPFENAPRTVDVRSVAASQGRYNIPGVGVFLWRLQSYPVENAAPHAAAAAADGRFTFNPFGFDAPLTNIARTHDSQMHRTLETDAPGYLRRLPLYLELEAARQANVDGNPPAFDYFNETEPVVSVQVAGKPVSPLELSVCDLSDVPAGSGTWRSVATTRTYVKSSDGSTVSLPITATLDPVLGRLVFPAGAPTGSVEVSYAYGFSGDLGGGPYDRSDSVESMLVDPSTGNPAVTWQVAVSATETAVPGRVYNSLAAAVADWNGKPSALGVIAIVDSATYVEQITGTAAVKIPAGCGLVVIAAAWPNASSATQPNPRALEPAGLRPTIRGTIEVVGTPGAAGLPPGGFGMNGVWLDGSLTVTAGALGALNLSHTTIAPTSGGLTIASGGDAGRENEGIAITLTRIVCGPLVLPADNLSRTLNATDSIVSSGGTALATAAAITAPSADVTASGITVFGTTTVRSLQASDAIFTGVVSAARKQTGCIRYSYLPNASATPRRYRCVTDSDPTAVLQFTSVAFGQPGFAQLSMRSSASLRTGAEDGAEMGAFWFLKQPQRITNLGIGIDEYLRFGLSAGAFYVT